MTWKQMFTSPVGKKYVMGLTGFFLITFLIVHASINSFIFVNDGGVTFNKVAHFMAYSFLLRLLEVGLFVGFIIHIIQGLILWKQNVAARPIKYKKQRYTRKIKWYSRYMGLLGTLILLFLIMHLSHFWYGTKNAMYFHGPQKNLFEEMKEIFTNPVWFTLYMIGLLSLLYHLLQGFQSAFQSMGMNDKKWTPFVKGLGVFYSIVMVLWFASMPIAFMTGWLQ